MVDIARDSMVIPDLDKKLKPKEEVLKEKISSLNLIPDEKKPIYARKINNLKFESEDEQSKFVKALNVERNSFKKDEWESLKESQWQRIKSKQNVTAQSFDEYAESLPASEKIPMMRDMILKGRFSKMPEDIKAQTLNIIKTNKLDEDKSRELVANITLLPDSMSSKVVSMMTGQPASKVNLIKETLDKLIFEDMPETFKEQAFFLRSSERVFKDDQIKKYEKALSLESQNENVANYFKANPKKREEMLEEIKNLKLDTPKGGVVSTLLSVLTREGQLFGAALDKAVGSLLTDNPDKANKYLADTQKLVLDAVSGNMAFPPSRAYDSYDTFKEMFGVKPVLWDKFYSNFSENLKTRLTSQKTLIDLGDKESNLYQPAPIRAAIDALKTVDPVDLYKEVMWNSTIGMAGFLKSAFATPLGIASSAIKVGKTSGTAITKLSTFKGYARSATPKAISGLTKAVNSKLLEDIKFIGSLTSKDIDDAGKFMAKTGANVDVITADKARRVYAFSKFSDDLNKIKEIRDRVVFNEAKLHRKIPLMQSEAEFITKQMSDDLGTLKSIAKGVGYELSTDPVRFKVAFKDGTQGLSKQGMKLMKQYRKGTSIHDAVKMEMDELRIAEEALSNPKLVDRGGVKLFGLTIPKTPELGEKISKTFSSIPVLNRFPGAASQVKYRINQYIRNKSGADLMSDELVETVVAKVPNKSDQARIVFAIEAGQTALLPKNLQEVAATVKTEFDNVHKKTLEGSQKLRQRLTDRGFTDSQVEFIMKSEDQANNYLDNYVAHIYKNKAFVKQLSGRKEANQAIALNKSINGIAPSALDVHTRTRDMFPTIADAYKVGLSKDKHVLVDDAIRKIVNGEDVDKNIKYLTKLGKSGADPEIGLREIMTARFRSFNKSFFEQDLSLNLADDLGFQTPLNHAMKESSVYVDIKNWSGDLGGKKISLPKEWTGLNIPKNVVDAFSELNKTPLRTKFRKALEEGVDVSSPTFIQSESIKNAANAMGFTALKALDTANNWFRDTATVFFPKFNSRNALSNVAMNTMAHGIKAYDPDLNYKIASLVKNAKNQKFGNDMILTNKFGQTVTGREFIEEMKKNGVFINMNDVAERTGASKWAEDFAYLAASKTGIGKALGKTGMAVDTLTKPAGWAYEKTKKGLGKLYLSQEIEDHARLFNAALNWREGNSFANSAAMSRKAMVDYGNMSNVQREYFNRVFPFFDFFRQNFINTVNTIVKNPNRAFVPVRAAARATGSNFAAPGPGEFVNEGQLPIYRDAGNSTVEQLSSVASSLEDLDRFTPFLMKTFEGFNLLTEKFYGVNNERELSKTIRQAKEEGVGLTFPVWQLPLNYVLSNAMGGEFVTRDRKLNPVLTKYASNIPPHIAEMVGIRFDVKPVLKKGKWEEESVAIISPMAAAVTKSLGGSRAISTAANLTQDDADTMEAVWNLFTPWTFSKHDRESELERYKQYTAKQIEREQKNINKELKDAIKSFKVQESIRTGKPLK